MRRFALTSFVWKRVFSTVNKTVLRKFNCSSNHGRVKIFSVVSPISTQASVRSYSSVPSVDDEFLAILSDAEKTADSLESLKNLDIPSLLSSSDSPHIFKWYGQLLDFMHGTFGMPWWLSIAASTLTIRLALYPLVTLRNQRIHVQYHNATPKLLQHHSKIGAARIKMDLKMILKEETSMKESPDVVPLVSVGPQLLNIGISVTVFLTQFLTTKLLAENHCASMNSGGLFWFEDLTAQSPTLASITSFAYIIWMMVRMEQSVSVGGKDSYTRIVGRTIVGGLGVGSLFLFASLPSATLVFCLTDFSLSALFAIVLSLPVYRNLLNIPHPVVFENPAKEGYIDLHSQVATGYQSGMGKIRAIKKANIANLREQGFNALLFDPEERKRRFRSLFTKKPKQEQKSE